MKVFVLFLTFGFSAYAYLPQEEQWELQQIHETCQADPETYCDEEQLEQFFQSRNYNQYHDEVGPHLYCMSEKAGLITDDGELNFEVVKSKIILSMQCTPEIALKLAQKCCQHYPDPYRTVVNLWSCFAEHKIPYTPKHYY